MFVEFSDVGVVVHDGKRGVIRLSKESAVLLSGAIRGAYRITDRSGDVKDLCEVLKRALPNPVTLPGLDR